MLSLKTELKARAHGLKPVVWVAENGVSDAVVKEIATALSAHELIKIRLNSDSREIRKAWILEICEKTGAQHIQTIGKIVVIFKKSESAQTAAESTVKKKTARRQKRDFQN